jgi:hypothetical protein
MRANSWSTISTRTIHRLADSPSLAVALLAGALGARPAAVPLAAQTVSPPVAEYQEKARSSFQLINGSIFPLAVVLEVKGFDITERGDVVEAPLDTARIRVKLSATSFRIPPRGTYTVFYEATGDSLPAWFQIMAALSGARTDNGINLRILLPHVVYLNQKAPLRRESVAVHRFEVDPASGRARALLENTGAELGRVLELTFDSPAGDSRSGGFPLLPRRKRWVELEWQRPAAPSRLLVRTAKFTLDTSLVAAPPAMQMADSTGSTDAPPSGASPGR